MAMPRKATPEKYCAYCGKKLERIEYPSKLETLFAFKRRKYCNRECMKRAFIKTDGTDQTFNNAHTSARKINELILKKDKCEICGSTQHLDIHHIDHDWHNNSPGNLMCVCRSCHNRIHGNGIKEVI